MVAHKVRISRWGMRARQGSAPLPGACSFTARLSAVAVGAPAWPHSVPSPPRPRTGAGTGSLSVGPTLAVLALPGSVLC